MNPCSITIPFFFNIFTSIQLTSMLKYSLATIIFLTSFVLHQSTSITKTNFAPKQIRTGAEQTEKYLPYLKGKKIGIVSNQTSIIGKTHLVDSLHKLSIN